MIPMFSPIDKTDSLALRNWPAILIGLGVVLIILGTLFAETFWSMVATWMRSDTYAHGFLILPISLWLIWEKREPLRGCLPAPTWVPVLGMLVAGLIWLIAYLVNVAVVQQYALVSLLILATWAMIGTPAARYLAFPLGFLLLAVPVGEALTHPLMNFTADFTVGMLRLTGIPVYRDGTFFSLPSGDWSVIEACSGIRYLLASVTLGMLFAYLTYRSLWKRVAFVGFAFLVPILANGLRAYTIVMIAHSSDMKLAIGVDHLIYGWVFFGIVIAIMFWIGSIWRDPASDSSSDLTATVGGRGVFAVALTVLAAGAFWPVLAWTLDRPMVGGTGHVDLQPPVAMGAWQAEPRNLWGWRPHVVGPNGDVYAFYRGDHGLVGLYIGVYRTQRHDAKLVTSANQMVRSSEREWSNKEILSRTIHTAAGEFSVSQSRLASRAGDKHLLVWSWYRIGDVNTSNPYLAKLVEASYRLFGHRQVGSLVAVATPYRDDVDQAASVLTEFIGTMMPAIGVEIARSVAVGS